MMWPDVYQQRLDPLSQWFPASWLGSTLLAAVPVLVLFWLLVPRRWPAPKAAAAAFSAVAIAVLAFGMPPRPASMAFFYGAAFGLLPIGWTIFNAMLLYNVTVQTGQFDVVRRSVAGLSGDARIQAVLIGFAFGAFLEGAAGSGTPVAICGAIMVGLGFDPFLAAVLCLIANTSADFITHESIGPDAWTLHPDEQTGVLGLIVQRPNVAFHGAVAKHRLVAKQLGAAVGLDRTDAVFDGPPAAIVGPPQWGEARRLLETFAEDLLGVQAAVDFVVHVFDARAVHQARRSVNHIAGFHGNGGVRSWGQRGRRK